MSPAGHNRICVDKREVSGLRQVNVEVKVKA